MRVGGQPRQGDGVLGWITARTVDRDEPADLVTRDAQLEAIARWGIPDPSKLARLIAITQPVFVANGDHDTMMITDNSRLLAQHLRNSQLRIHPDSGHGFLDQYPELFGDHVRSSMADELAQRQLRFAGLEATLHRGLDQPLRFRLRHVLAEEVAVAKEVLGRRERDGIDALLDDRLPRRGERGDPVYECSPDERDQVADERRSEQVHWRRRYLRE